MDYYVIGDDGTEYGPASLSTLQQWVEEGRVTAVTRLKSYHTGRVASAGSVKMLFPTSVGQPAGAPRPFLGTQAVAPISGTSPASFALSAPDGDGASAVFWAIVRAMLAIAFASRYSFPAAGLVTGIYGMYCGIRAFRSEHRFGTAALVLSLVALVLVIGIDLFKGPNLHPGTNTGVDSADDLNSRDGGDPQQEFREKIPQQVPARLMPGPVSRRRLPQFPGDSITGAPNGSVAELPDGQTGRDSETQPDSTAAGSTQLPAPNSSSGGNAPSTGDSPPSVPPAGLPPPDAPGVEKPAEPPPNAAPDPSP